MEQPAGKRGVPDLGEPERRVEQVVIGIPVATSGYSWAREARHKTDLISLTLGRVCHSAMNEDDREKMKDERYA